MRIINLIYLHDFFLGTLAIHYHHVFAPKSYIGTAPGQRENSRLCQSSYGSLCSHVFNPDWRNAHGCPFIGGCIAQNYENKWPSASPNREYKTNMLFSYVIMKRMYVFFYFVRKDLVDPNDEKNKNAVLDPGSWGTALLRY